MDFKMNPNAVNQFPKGTDFFLEGESVFTIAMIIKGRVLIHNDGARVLMGSGAFLGVNDLYTGKFQSTYTAYDDLLIYVYPVKRVDELESVLSSNKDYHGFMVASFYKMIYELEQIYQGLMKNSSELYQFLKETYQVFQSLAAKKGFKKKLPDRITTLSVPDSDLDPLSDRINYYIECRNLPIEAVKQFYSYGNVITLYQVEDQVSIVNQQLEALKEMAEEYISMAGCLIDDSDSCLFHLIDQLSAQIGGASGNELIDILDNIVEELNKAEIFTEKMLGVRLKADRKKMEEVYHRLLTGDINKAADKNEVKQTKEDNQRALNEYKDSFSKILEYAGISGEKAEKMKSVMEDYVSLEDKLSTADNTRAMRRQLTEHHYEIYKQVFLRAYKEKNASRVIELFLRYGFADERLLNRDQLLSLYFLPEEEVKTGLCNVYSVKDWLTLIYEGKKEPSKNEFDQEYSEMVTILKKQSKLTEKEAAEWNADPERRLEYEIQNMFRYNNRTTNGQITTFVPVLHEDQVSGDFERIIITANKVNESVAKIMKIDYSVFDREVLYVNKVKNIVKEYIIKRVFPDIILMPNVGINGIMWQEISGKRRDSASRFLLPSFTEISLDIILIRVLGRFRWEMCRTIEGISWNDITQKSLTSEYSDYLQFYNKNKDLTEEKKEKIKHQIQKGRNSSREIFVLDYEQWINYEAMGALKLNKPVREILATYCPFSKEIREQVKLQPQFEEAMIRYNREKQKKIREVEGRHRLLIKDQIEITQELADTLNYYKNT